MGIIKRFHLEIDAADLPNGVGVGASARRDSKGAAQLLRSPIVLRPRTVVEDLNDVDLIRDPLDRLFAEVSPGRVVRVFEVNEAALLLDGGDRLLRRESSWHRRAQEETDQFAFCRQNLLADDGVFTGLNKQPSAVDPVVVGQENGGETQLGTPAGHLEWRHTAIKRRGAMQVQVHPDPGAPCAARHVRYYRSRRGLREGSNTTKWWLLTG